MKNHGIFKLLAVALCAACLFAAVASGAGLMALAALNLGENVSPSQRYLQDREESLNWIAGALAERYAAKTAPKADEALVEQYYLDRYTTLKNANYEIRDSKGKVLERKDGQTGSFTDFTFRIAKGDRTYVEVLEGPIYVETMEAAQQAAQKLAGKDALEEDFFPGIHFPIREELADGGSIYAIDYKDGWNIYKIQDVPLNQNYTVVIHADLTAGDNALEARLFSMMDEVWRHQAQVAALLGVSLVAFALLAVYLCCAAGHKPGSQEIRPGGLNCLPLDLYLAVLLGFGLLYAYIGIMGVRYLMSQGNTIAFVYYGYGGYLCCLLFVGFCFACAAQFKTPGCYWWRHSVTGLCWKGLAWCWRFFWKCAAGCYHILWAVALPILQWVLGLMKKCWAWVKRLWKRLGALLVKIYGLLPLSWQWILAGVLLVGICPLALATDSLLLLWIGLLGGAALVIYGAVNFGTLLDAAKRMRGGDLEIKVDDKLMLGAFRDFAVELNGLSDVVQLAAQKQMRSERMRTELITNVSHDIKTPLTSIINYVDLLQKPHSQEDGEKYLEVLSRQSGRMKRLIDDLIELSKASTGNIPLELTKIDAVEAVNQALGEFTDKLKAAGLTPLFRQPEEPLYIHADGRLLWRAMSNLLSNAVKYAQPGTRLYIDMVAVDKKVCISLKNISRDPLNISAEELMERFVRGEASRNQEGSGLGLNIAQSMMELQHGALELLVDGDLFKATLIFPQED